MYLIFFRDSYLEGFGIVNLLIDRVDVIKKGNRKIWVKCSVIGRLWVGGGFLVLIFCSCENVDMLLSFSEF